MTAWACHSALDQSAPGSGPPAMTHPVATYEPNVVLKGYGLSFLRETAGCHLTSVFTSNEYTVSIQVHGCPEYTFQTLLKLAGNSLLANGKQQEHTMSTSRNLFKGPLLHAPPLSSPI